VSAPTGPPARRPAAARTRRCCRPSTGWPRSPGISRHAAEVMVWHLLADRATRFDDLGEDYYINTIDTDRRARSHIRQLQALGFTVTITTPAAA
jgi:hypothetical protein